MNDDNELKWKAIVLMGPAGCGKTSVGLHLATARNALFIDADAHHSQASIEKMSRGIGLTDEDRAPWLLQLATLIHDITVPHDIVLACSALKQSYRRVLANGPRQVSFIYLRVGFEELERRLTTRSAHFAGADLLRSQLECLEVPSKDETIDATASFEQVCAAVEQLLGPVNPLVPLNHPQEA